MSLTNNKHDTFLQQTKSMQGIPEFACLLTLRKGRRPHRVLLQRMHWGNFQCMRATRNPCGHLEPYIPSIKQCNADRASRPPLCYMTAGAGTDCAQRALHSVPPFCVRMSCTLGRYARQPNSFLTKTA